MTEKVLVIYGVTIITLPTLTTMRVGDLVAITRKGDKVRRLKKGLPIGIVWIDYKNPEKTVFKKGERVTIKIHT